MGLSLIFSLILILIFFYQKSKNQRSRELLAKIPTISSVPILGHALHFVNKSPAELLELSLKIANDIGLVGFISILGNDQIVISDPKISEQILSSIKFIEKSNFYEFFQKWLGTGLLMSGSQKWHVKRKYITPAFHFKILEEFVEVFNKHSDVFVEKLKKLRGGETEIFHHVSLFAMDAICETAMGHELNSQTNGESEYVKAVQEITKIIFKRVLDPITHSDFIYRFTRTHAREVQLVKILHKFSYDVINKRREFLKKKPHDDHDEDVKKRKLAFLDLMLQLKVDGKSLSDEELREEVDLFIFAGHDTITSAITFTLLNLAKHPKIQQQVYEECRDILEGIKSPNLQDLKKLNYLEKVIKESLRIYPSVPFISRVLNEEVQCGDYTFPAGVSVTISPFIMGRHKSNFEDPLKFDPSRFDDDLKNHFAFVPFSAGPRNCIGQKFAMFEMKSVLSKIISTFEVLIKDENREPKIMYETILRPVNGVMLSFKERQ